MRLDSTHNSMFQWEWLWEWEWEWEWDEVEDEVEMSWAELTCGDEVIQS